MLSKGELRYDSIWDRFVLRKIHKMFGGRLRLITTGGAPISSDVLNFSRAVYGCPCFEGYGQTENAAAGTLTLPHSTQTGNVGGPAPWAQVRSFSGSLLVSPCRTGKACRCSRLEVLRRGRPGRDLLSRRSDNERLFPRRSLDGKGCGRRRKSCIVDLVKLIR